MRKREKEERNTTILLSYNNNTILLLANSGFNSAGTSEGYIVAVVAAAMAEVVA